VERVLLDLCALVGGFLLLAKGADWLVRGSSELAGRLGVRPMVVGLTVVAWGTSAPELVISTLAAAEGKAAISVGNVLGSNVANIGLVLGICALILPGVIHRLDRREVLWLLASIAALWWCARDQVLSRLDGGFLLGLFGLYNLHVYQGSHGGPESQDERLSSEHPWREVLLGTIGIAVGARLIVWGAESLALAAGISQRVVGLTVIAVGTSLPELAAGIGSSLRRQTDISLGNVVGSNVFNLLPVLGIAALIRPLEGVGGAEALRQASGVDLPVVLAFTAAVILLPRIGGGRAPRWRGGLLLAAYLLYGGWLFSNPG
jgi:cation:H+ antiporter